MDECVDERTLEIVRSCGELAVSADEPKGVDRVGVRLTAIPRGGCEVRRMFLELAPLKEVVARIPRPPPRSSEALSQALKDSLLKFEAYGKVDLFTPAGAPVFGALQAESLNDGESVLGHNVCSHSDAVRRLTDPAAEPLTIVHCVAHRGSFANKDAKFGVVEQWQSYFTRQCV